MGDKGIDMRPTKTSGMQIMQREDRHASHSQADLRYIINVHTQDKREYDDQMDSDTKTTRSKMIKIIYQQVDQHVESNDVQ